MHRNARLRPQGVCRCVSASKPVGPSRTSPRRWGSLAIARYVWWRRYQAKASPASRIARAARTAHRTQTKPSRERRIVRVAPQPRAWASPDRGHRWACRHRPCMRCLVRHGLNRLDHLDRVTRHRSDGSRCPGPGELVHVDIKKLGRIPKVAAGGSTAERHERERPLASHQRRLRVRALRHRRLQPSRLQRSPRRRARRHRSRVLATRRPRSSPRTTSPSNACSPTTAPATAAASSPPRSAPSSTPSPSPTDPRPTARSNGSTAPCSPNGPTPAPGAQTANAPAHLPAGSTLQPSLGGPGAGAGANPTRRPRPRARRCPCLAAASWSGLRYIAIAASRSAIHASSVQLCRVARI